MGFLVQCKTSDTSPSTLSISTNGRPSLSRKPVTFTVQNSKGPRSQISSKQIITIADEAEITASTNVLLVYMSKQRLFCTPCSCSKRSYPELAHLWDIHRERLRIGNLGTKLLFIYCARSVNGQWNAELKRIFPEVFVFPFRWTRVTEALGTRLGWIMIQIIKGTGADMHFINLTNRFHGAVRLLSNR